MTIRLWLLRSLCLACLLGGLGGLARAAPVVVEVSGVEGVAAENIRAWLDDGTEIESPLAARFFRDRARQRVFDALMAVGFYAPEVVVELVQQADEWILRVNVEPGERVLVRAFDWQLLGEGEQDSALLELLDELPLHPGDGLHHGAYDRSKSALHNLALSRGYFDHEFETARLAVNPDQGWADIDWVFRTGKRYELGEVMFSPTPFTEEFLDRLIPFTPGTPYTSDAIATLNQRLLESGYFSDVVVTTRRDAADDARVPVDAQVKARERNTVLTGAGYSTDEGPRVRLGFTRHYINNRGHRLNSDLRLSELRQSISSRYTVPLTDPLNDELTFDAGWEDETVDGNRSERALLGLGRRITFNSGWTRNQTLQLLNERFRVGADEGRATLLLPGLSFARTRARGGLDPHWGDYQSYQLQVASKDLLSDIDIARLEITQTWLRSVSERHRFQVRAQWGGIATNDFGDTPLSLRFFAGGDQSIRGFSFRSLGPRDATGEVTGGRYLAVGSAEYSYGIRAGWRAAAFVDAGNAFNQLADMDVEVGTGFGLRWSSPVGPLRLDLAWGVSRDDLPVRLHLSIGPPF